MCVVGISDALYGDLVAAFIVRAAGVEIDEAMVHNMVLQRYSLKSHCCTISTFPICLFIGHLGDELKLRGGIYFVDALPLTPSGKIIRRKVKEIVVELQSKEKKSVH